MIIMYIFSPDPTITSDNVSKVVVSIGEDELGSVLDVAVSKREEFQQQSSTPAEYRERLIEYFIKYSPRANWSDLATRLYWHDQYKAVDVVKIFLTQTPGMCHHPYHLRIN